MTPLVSSKQTQRLIHELVVHLCQAVIYVLILRDSRLSWTSVFLPITSTNAHFSPFLKTFPQLRFSSPKLPPFLYHTMTSCLPRDCQYPLCLKSDLNFWILPLPSLFDPLGLHTYTTQESCLGTPFALSLEACMGLGSDNLRPELLTSNCVLVIFTPPTATCIPICVPLLNESTRQYQDQYIINQYFD